MEAGEMTPVEKFKWWWQKYEDEIVGWAFIGTAVFITAKLSYKLGYIHGAADLVNTLGNLFVENNS